MRKLFVFAALWLFCITLRADFTGTVIDVHDGDTITVKVDFENTLKKVRLYGIDAPELNQAHGEVSRDMLVSMIFYKPVKVMENGTDRYNRVIGIVTHMGVDIGGTMVLNGYAWCYRDYDKEKLYWAIEDEAKRGHRGLWGAGTPVAPWVFRKEQKGKS